MATTTTNFNFPIPQSTDLVKDGATAIAALGTSVDTQFVDLKGGTTGQVLSKASNTDLDFTWVAQDDSNAIQNAIVDAKGDLIAATAADTPARLAVGNNGETLVADSSTSTGLRYTAGTVQSNPVLNSAFQVWQRGTSISLAASTGFPTGFVADRWQTSTGVNQASTISRQSTNDTTNLPNIQYCLRYQRNSGQTGTGNLLLAQSFETINAIPFAGKTITFSFYARAGANYSATSNTLGVVLSTGTGTDQNITSGYTGAAFPINLATATLTTTWQRFTYTANIASSATELGVYLQFTPTGTAGAADFYEITGVQIDIGSVALPFRTYAGTIQGELAACQRYYQRFGAKNGQTVGTNATYGSGFATSTTGVNITVPFPVTMRTTPTAIEYASITAYDAALTQYTPSAVAIVAGQSGLDAGNVQLTVTGATAARAAVIIQSATTGYLAFSAEL